MAELVLLDTMICLWGMKGQATPGQEHKIRDAQRFLDYLDEEGFEVAISAVTLSELLVACGESEREELAKEIGETLLVLSFDVGSAIQASILFQNWKQKNESTSNTRQTVKADCQILGTAIAHGASTLFTEDKEILKMAGNRIKVLPIPPQAQQELDLL